MYNKHICPNTLSFTPESTETTREGTGAIKHLYPGVMRVAAILHVKTREEASFHSSNQARRNAPILENCISVVF